MTDNRAPRPPLPRDCWALLPPPVAQAILGVLYDALDRRPPFGGIEHSAFDVALSRVPPPHGLTREQFRRAVFEEMNLLPWSAGLEPPEGDTWLRYTPVETAADRIFFIRPDLYRLTRKVAKRVVDGMRADGLLGAEADVELFVDLLNGDFCLMKVKRGEVRLSTNARAVFRAAPMVHSEMFFAYSDRVPCVVRPRQIFLDPDLGPIDSDEEAERVIRQMWRYADALFGAVQEALHDVPPAIPGNG